MNLAQLEQSVRDFLVGDYRVYFYVIEQEIVGYALFGLPKRPSTYRVLYLP